MTSDAHDVWVETPYGVFYPKDPVLDLKACAHSLAQVNRYNGHAAYPFPVAMHAVLVSFLMEEVVGGDPFEGLHHDDEEYVVQDLAAPYKPIVPDYRALSKGIDRAFREQLGLPLEKTHECEIADKLALFIEAYQLMPSKGEGWGDKHGVRPWALKLRQQGWRIQEVDWRRARDVYTQRHNSIKPVNIPSIEF